MESGRNLREISWSVDLLGYPNNPPYQAYLEILEKCCFFGRGLRFMPLRQEIKQISCKISNTFEFFTNHDFLHIFQNVRIFKNLDYIKKYVRYEDQPKR